MKMRASYNPKCKLPYRRKIIADMKMRASYNPPPPVLHGNTVLKPSFIQWKSAK